MKGRFVTARPEMATERRCKRSHGNEYCVNNAYRYERLGLGGSLRILRPHDRHGLVGADQDQECQRLFTASGAMPWWLSGISHHMSGYSTRSLLAMPLLLTPPALPSTSGGPAPIALELLIGYSTFPPRWARLRLRTGMISPLEFLVPATTCHSAVLAWSGALFKIFDIGAKWTATPFC